MEIRLNRIRPRRARRGQEGFVLPTVTFMVMAAIAVASIATVVTIRAQGGTSRDQSSKIALAIAEAGVQEALYRYNRVIANGAASCVVSNGDTVYLAEPIGGWCAPVRGGTTQGSFVYRVAPKGSAGIEIVSRGTANGVARRVNVEAESSSGQRIFSKAGVQSIESLVRDANSQIRSSSATNGDVELGGNAKLCGAASVGVGRRVVRASAAVHHAETTCAGLGEATQKPLDLPPVNQGNAATVNDNGRFFSLDIRQPDTDRVSWDPTTRELSLRQNSSLTLGGRIYSFCKLTMSSNTAIYVAPGSNVVIYFDSPENCNQPSGTTQLNLSSNSRITSTGGGPSNVAILMVGSSTLETRAQLNSNTQVANSCNQNFVIYAPRTVVDLDSNSIYCGAIAAKSVHMDSNSRIFQDSGANNFVLPYARPHYVVTQFLECSTDSPSPPDAGC
jgi:Tfp pilus assembly protein PilX